jgi:CheY-like chemotaxis protein
VTPLHVLVVEDDAVTARALSDYLEADGYSVRTAGDGPTALALAAADPPDAALIDVNLPGMDGYAVARALRRVRPERRPLFLILTGNPEESLCARSWREGMDLHLVKPVDPEAINGILRRFAEVLLPPDVPPPA